MQYALKEAEKALAKDEVPIGAVIVHNETIIGKGFNQVEMMKDPTAHAEMIAITAATSHLSQKWLNECTLYVTLEPCSMCAGAIVLARMQNLVFASFDPKTGACGSVHSLVEDKRLNHRVHVISGVMDKECGGLLQEFFRKKRKNIL